MDSQDVLPYVPDEEVAIYNDLQEIYRSLVQLRKTSSYSLAAVKDLEEKVDANLDELLTVRKEFKRLRNTSESSLEEILKKDSRLPLSELALVLTPTDVLVGQISNVIGQLVEPFVKNLSPVLYPIYARLNSIQQALEGFKNTGAYSLEDDITPFQLQLRDIENTHLVDGKWISNEQPKDLIPEGQAILSGKLHSCYRLAHNLISDIESLAPSLVPVHHRLVAIWNRLNHILTKGNVVSYSTSEIATFQRELRSIDSLRHGHGDVGIGFGSFVNLDSTLPSGQATVVDLLENCFELSHSLLSLKDPVSGALRPNYEYLINFRRELESLFETRHFWSLGGDSNNIYERVIQMQTKLKEIDGLRVDGKFVEPSNSNSIPEGQAVLHFLLHKCYRLVYKILMHISLIIPQSPMSPTPKNIPIAVEQELIPLHKNLLTVRRCLLALKKHAPWDENDLNPWKLKLAKYEGDMEKLPESNILHALWNECVDIIGEMEHTYRDVGGDESGDTEEIAKSSEDDEESDNGAQKDSYGRYSSYRPMPVAGFDVRRE